MLILILLMKYLHIFGTFSIVVVWLSFRKSHSLYPSRFFYFGLNNKIPDQIYLPRANKKDYSKTMLDMFTHYVSFKKPKSARTTSNFKISVGVGFRLAFSSSSFVVPWNVFLKMILKILYSEQKMPSKYQVPLQMF